MSMEANAQHCRDAARDAEGKVRAKAWDANRALSGSRMPKCRLCGKRLGHCPHPRWLPRWV